MALFHLPGRQVAICLVLAGWVSTVSLPVAASQLSAAAQRAAADTAKRAAAQSAQRNAAAKATKSAPLAPTKTAAPDKTVGIYRTPLCKSSAPCPLPEHVSNTFVGAYEKKVLSQDTLLYRVYATPERTLGATTSTSSLKRPGDIAALTQPQYSYWSRHDQRGLQAAIDAGLEVSKFGNTAGRQVVIRVPKGATIFEGKARGDVSSLNQAGKVGEGVRHNPVGGGNQIVIQDVPSAWIIQP
jgi:hypothetical protein